MATPDLVSIVIPTYNSARTIERCIRSLQAQTHPAIEILVIDNHSQDGTPEIAARCGARVFTVGPERSAQVNRGVMEALGDYVYRVDGDFEVDPDVVSACVNLIHEDGCDAVVIPNRSVGESFWARVRALERETYLRDDLMVAARFWKRSVFLSVGGLDESLNACEDLDFHSRLLQQGYRIGHILPEERHLGEANHLVDYARESFYYGPSIARYLVKHPSRGLAQSIPVRPSYLRHLKLFRQHPGLALGLAALKFTQYTAAGLGIIADILGITSGRGQVSQKMLVVLAVVLTASFGISGLLQWWGLGTPFNYLVALPGCLLLWQWSGRKAALNRAIPLQTALIRSGLTFLTLPGLLLPGIGAYPFLITLLIAAFAGWITWVTSPAISDPGHRAARKWARDGVGLGLISLVALTWWVYEVIQLYFRLGRFAESGFSLILVDQALWSLVHPTGQVGNWFISSITGRNLLADVEAPILLVFAPFYAAGWGGPLLLMAAQWAALAFSALLLYGLIRRFLGFEVSTLLALVYLVFLFVLRASSGSFNPLVFANPLLLLALKALNKRAWGVYLGFMLLTLLCGLETGWMIAGIGLTLLIRRDLRMIGMVTLVLGLGWVWAMLTALIPFLGGNQPYWADLSMVKHLLRQETVIFIVTILSPLIFLPALGPVLVLHFRHVKLETRSTLAGIPLGLAAFPLLVLTLMGDRLPIGLEGWLGPLLALLLLLSVIDFTQIKPAWGRALSASMLAGCMVAGLNSGIFQSMPEVPSENAHIATGRQMLGLIPPQAAVATQRSYALALAHRHQLTVLPKVGQAEYLLFDLFHPDHLLDPGVSPQVLRQAYYNPEFHLQEAASGYLLFARGPQQPGENDARLALVSDPVIKYPRETVLGGEVAFMGFNISKTWAEPGEIIYLTLYWKCLAPLSRPFLLFTAYPGARLFDEFAFGLYPPALWQPGQIIRHEQAIALPSLPDGDDYEMVVGLWYDTGMPELRSEDQLLGRNVIRTAAIRVRDGHIELVPWVQGQSEGR